jgi:hypothetical protein
MFPPSVSAAALVSTRNHLPWSAQEEDTMQVTEPKSSPRLIGVADAMHALLIKRADQLAGYGEGSAEEVEFGSIADILTAYELLRWPEGKEPGGKG